MNNPRIVTIWKAVLNGRQDALGTLFDEFYNSLVNYGIKLYPQKAFVKDCIQDVFMNIWSRRENLSQVDNVRSYIFTALRMRIIELIRQYTARTRRQRKYTEASLDELLNIEQMIIRDETDKRRKEALQKGLKKLSNRQKEAIYLKFFCGFTNDEIADIMKLKKQSTYNLIFESLKKLEQYFSLLD